MAEKNKHSNDEIFELLSAMAVDIEDLKKNSSKITFQSDDDINPLKCLEKEVCGRENLSNPSLTL